MNAREKLEAIIYNENLAPIDQVKAAREILLEARNKERERWRRFQHHVAECTDSGRTDLTAFECPYCDKVIR